MKDTKQDKSKSKPKRSAEDWVAIARLFGEECIAIQHDTILNLEQKLERQSALADELAKEIKNDSHLKEDEKKAMVESIHKYIEEWTSMQRKIQGKAKATDETKKKAKK